MEKGSGEGERREGEGGMKGDGEREVWITIQGEADYELTPRTLA